MTGSLASFDLALLHLEQARAHVDVARHTCARAGDATWISVAAEAYRSELAGLTSDLAALGAAIDLAWERAWHARWSLAEPP